MAENDHQERTEQPSAKRLREAREKGDVPRSRDLNAAAVTLSIVATLLMTHGMIGQHLAAIMRAGLSHQRADAFDTHAVLVSFAYITWQALLALAPVFVVGILSAILAPMALGGWTFSMQALGFKADRLDPISGIARVFSTRGLVELLKALAKVIVISVATYFVLRQASPGLLKTGMATAPLGIGHALNLIGNATLLLVCALVAISLIDVPWQMYSHNKRLRMTREELREEFKETEGRPEVKSRIRSLQNQMARRRMMQEVPKADVVITNPTHYAVALRYDDTKMRAPIVVAKGSELVAAQIRKIASEHGVPILSSPPLARALHFTTEIGAAVPTTLYVAVAQVLAWVYRLKLALKTGDVIPEPPVPQVDPALADPKHRI